MAWLNPHVISAIPKEKEKRSNPLIDPWLQQAECLK